MNFQTLKRFTLFPLLTFLFLIPILVCNIKLRGECGPIWISCPDAEQSQRVCKFCRLLSTATKGDILYFRVFDCKTKKTLQSSVSATCEVR